VTQNIAEVTHNWEMAIDSCVIQAATKDWSEYSLELQRIIEAEVHKRGLWPKVSFLRNDQNTEQVSQERYAEKYVCEGCRGTHLNADTGRCGSCKYPSDYLGYCRECDKFWPLYPGKHCPEHKTILLRYKSATALLRIGNLLLEDIFVLPFAYVTVFVIRYIDQLISINGLISRPIFINIDPLGYFILLNLSVYLYYFVFETIWQRTPAKFITGTKVITKTGGKPSMGTIAIRTLFRFVPFDPLSFVGKSVYGWHDKWSKTYVVKTQ
jgi:uncharacterized RDD family membrane protein YckC